MAELDDVVKIDPDSLTIKLIQEVDARDLYSYLQDQLRKNMHWPGPMPIAAISWQEPCSCKRPGFTIASLRPSPWAINPINRIVNVRWEP